MNWFSNLLLWSPNFFAGDRWKRRWSAKIPNLLQRERHRRQFWSPTFTFQKKSFLFLIFLIFFLSILLFWFKFSIFHGFKFSENFLYYISTQCNTQRKVGFLNIEWRIETLFLKITHTHKVWFLLFLFMEKLEKVPTGVVLQELVLLYV